MKYSEKDHLVFMGIRVWDALAGKFTPPEGSEPRPCRLCHNPLWVQRSFLKLIRKGRKTSMICFRCAADLGIDYRKPDMGSVVPEALPEYERWVKAGRP